MMTFLKILSLLAKVSGLVVALDWTNISPTLGPIIFFAASLTKDVANRLGDYFDDGKINQSFGNVAKVLLIGALVFPAIGCRNLESGGAYNGDRALFEADTVIVTSYDTLHTFVKWEKDNRPALAAYPEIKRSADHIRANAKNWIASAIAAREAYSLAPTTDTRDDLTRAVAVLRAALTESVKYLNERNP